MNKRPPTLFQADPGKAARSKASLFAAALRLFGEKGPDGATVREIAAEAGQNVASIAYYFGGKAELYGVVLNGIVEGIRKSLADVLEKVETLRSSGRDDSVQAVQLLKKFLAAVYLRLLSRDDATSIVQIVVREQLGPTPGFDILYERGFRQVHEALCFLAGMALGRDCRSREIIIRTHILMGQVYFFAMSREAILRRLGWRTLEGRNAELVAALVEEHVEVLLAGLLDHSNAARKAGHL